MIDPTAESFARRLDGRRADLSRSELVVAEYIGANAERAIFLSALELADATHTSDATVIRTARALGYSGLPELKHELGAELVDQKHPAHRLVTRIAMVRSQGSAGALLHSVFSEAVESMREAERLLDPAAFERAVDAIAGAGSVVTFGVGVMRVTAEYFALGMRRHGVRAHHANHMGFALADELLLLGQGDAAVLFVPGRVVRDVEVIIDHARAVGASVVLITDQLRHEFADRVDVVLDAQVSSSGLTGDPLIAMVVVDALLLALAQRDEPRATDRSKVLNRLRKALLSRRSTHA